MKNLRFSPDFMFKTSQSIPGKVSVVLAAIVKLQVLMILLILGGLSSCGNRELQQQVAIAPVSEQIRVNQLGYFPGLGKQFTVDSADTDVFCLADDRGRIVYTGKLKDFGFWKPSGEKLKTGDFSDFHEPGTYFIYVEGLGKSYPFNISKGIYSVAAIDALRTFYFMRVSIDIEEKYVGKFARPAGHPDDTCYYHESTGSKGGFRSSPGGWYDAGDYGKYIVNASVSTGTMMLLGDLQPGYYPDSSLNIPESGNGVNDLLDEMRYEFEWVLTMQDDDGGVFHKLTPMMHDGITMPAKTHSRRYIFAKSTAASLDLAAMLAQASRAFSEIDPEFAASCLDAATRAYDWSVKNPEKYFSNPPGNNTGGYGDRDLSEEFFWAAAELFCTTGDSRYYDVIKPSLDDIRFRVGESWGLYVDNIGYYSLCLCDKLDEGDRNLLERAVLMLADKLIDEADSSPYGIPIDEFHWGSNSDVLNAAVVEIMAHKISGETKYLAAAAMITDYIFGRNAAGYSFVSGHGSKYSQNFHHRLLWADDNDEAFPGFVAGGPNGGKQDWRGLKEVGLSYPEGLPAKSYLDHNYSYASNEVCINWNAPLVLVLAYLDSVSEKEVE